MCRVDEHAAVVVFRGDFPGSFLVGVFGWPFAEGVSTAHVDLVNGHVQLFIAASSVVV